MIVDGKVIDMKSVFKEIDEEYGDVLQKLAQGAGDSEKEKDSEDIEK